MARGLITRDSDGKTVDLDKQDAEQADVTYFAKKVKIVDSVGEDITANNPLPTTLPNTGYATSAKQDTLLTELQLKADLTETQPVSIDTLPLPSGASIELTQSSIKSLIETLQELTNRLTVLSSVKGVNESLRVTPLSSVSTAVTGPITSVQSIAEKNVAGVGYTQRVAIENITAIQSNINNCIGI